MGELFDYVMQTPGNTNPAVLSSEIQKLIDSSRVTPDWNTMSPLIKNGGESYIKNRPFYPAILTGVLSPIEVDWKNTEPGSINLMGSFTDYFSAEMEKDISYDAMLSKTLPRQYCLVSVVRGKISPSSPETLSVSYFPGKRATLTLLDEKNYCYKDGDYGSYYIIFDISLLTNENKTLFPKKGIYYKRNSLRPSYYEYYYSTIKLYNGTAKISEIYLPETIQGITISDSNNYFSTKTVEGALDQIGSQLSSKELILDSSTADSTKKFKITVDDTGTVTATKINET